MQVMMQVMGDGGVHDKTSTHSIICRWKCFLVSCRPHCHSSWFKTIYEKFVPIFQTCNLDDFEQNFTSFEDIIFESETK
jgi:hypothetical protein